MLPADKLRVLPRPLESDDVLDRIVLSLRMLSSRQPRQSSVDLHGNAG